jgi:hypothetical protein
MQWEMKRLLVTAARDAAQFSMAAALRDQLKSKACEDASNVLTA